MPRLAQKFADEMSAKYKFPIEAVDSNQEAVQGADIIVTVTSTTEPILERNWIVEGAHLNVVGSCFPHCRETDTEVSIIRGGALAIMQQMIDAAPERLRRLRVQLDQARTIHAILRDHITYTLGRQMRMMRYL